MKIQNIPLASIVVPEIRVTAVYDDELLEQFKSSVGAIGQLEPIICVKEGEEFILVDGLHRLQEAQARGAKTIPGVVMPGDSTTAMLFNLATNRLRGKTRASEMVDVIGHLANNVGIDSDEIRAKTGFTRDYIEKLWKISEAHPAVRAALDAQLVGVGVAFQVSRLPDPAQQEMVMNQVGTYHMTVAETTKLVDETLRQMKLITEEPEPAPRPEPPPPRCDGCHEVANPRFLAMHQLCPACVGKIFTPQHQAPEPVAVGEKSSDDAAPP